ncbi:hypothetical protein PPTG_22455 [Phytophthora nicotianae INRA-310]|uniref:Uncharacterized protein n=4 Tax=Phytophthora nicotianae TaxID=4792 RepID=W2QG43_PHYN3|nr:hypothetical protein PPTG_22455 [Phytophthora nicotianae INRA-310]ETI51981.1 hypothetical protein F443_04780 [Phytophthora nicotianae P1569]ETM51572.1 hypothetical protein L914_04616 [Phytophthora nicotianae]ETN12142.1 hypothetical protein PPTG_22455 [Phytophthora nicotianae INRA-310]ETO80728.1 hypothetical protein F444_04833 [Phytophthora nicotianae P1976]
MVPHTTVTRPTTATTAATTIECKAFELESGQETIPASVVK